jgi:hypothetical protein
MIRLIRAWIQAWRPWGPLEDTRYGFVRGKPEPYREATGRWS